MPRQPWATIGVTPRPASVARRSASFPVAPTLGEGPERAQGQRQTRPGPDLAPRSRACQPPDPPPPRSAAGSAAARLKSPMAW